MCERLGWRWMWGRMCCNFTRSSSQRNARSQQQALRRRKQKRRLAFLRLQSHRRSAKPNGPEARSGRSRCQVHGHHARADGRCHSRRAKAKRHLRRQGHLRQIAKAKANKKSKRESKGKGAKGRVAKAQARAAASQTRWAQRQKKMNGADSDPSFARRRVNGAAAHGRERCNC